ncbi:MAG TPA: DUF1887 family CARF protein [Candidatus Paceibacterota bacterium]|nr:DUF1887 family CARF protein [Candidatus Paceibacterota bacterium]
MAKVLVSLVSDQTIPNLELIKEFRNDIDQFLFIVTEQKNDQLKWITETARIKEYKKIPVDPFCIKDIEMKLSDYDFADNEYILNITGGTKLMTIIIEDFFKRMGAKIFYVTGHKKQYLKVFPAFGVREFEMKSKLTLTEYLNAYGFEVKKSNPLLDKKKSEITLKKYLKADPEIIKPVLSVLQNKRNISMTPINSIKGLDELLDYFEFKPKSNNEISKHEARYLTGDWFEEYVYYKVKDELKLDDEEIGKGYELKKKNVRNEIDVIFIFEQKLFIIECKTSFYHIQTLLVEKNGEKEAKKNTKNLLSEIIYKSDALKTKFGLFANTSIFTLAPINDDKGCIIENLKPHIERAELSNIKIISRNDIIENKSFADMLNIK